VATGLAVSLAHPGGNVTGFTGYELGGKRLELLREVLPAVSCVGALWNPATTVLSLKATEEAARILGLQLRPIAVAAPDEISAGFEAAVGSGPAVAATIGIARVACRAICVAIPLSVTMRSTGNRTRSAAIPGHWP
jgi:putative ABC transport system substrate-binding protein